MASCHYLLTPVFPGWMHTGWWALISLFLTKSALSTKLVTLTFTVYFLLAVSQISQNQSFKIKSIFSEKHSPLYSVSQSEASLQAQYVIQKRGSHSRLLVPHSTHLIGDQVLQTQALPCVSIFPLMLISEIFMKQSWLDCIREWKRRNISKIISKYVYNMHWCCSLETEYLLWKMSVLGLKAFQLIGWGPPTLSSIISFM